jgi:type I restriction enzyme S subunit
MTRTKTPEGGHSGPPLGGLENSPAVTSKNKFNAFGSSPEDWTEKSLGDILTLNYGWSLPEKKRIPGDAPVYGSNGIVGTHQQALVASPGLIIGRKGSAGNVHYSRRPFCPIDTTFYIAPSDTSLDIEFLYFLLLHIDLKRILGDVGVPGLNREMAYREKARFPTGADEQRKIAAVLGLVQQALEQQERLIALTTELKKALLHQLFTQGLRGEPQKQTDLGPIPESWEVRSIGSVAQVKGGKRLPKGEKFADGPTPFPYIRVTDFAKLGVDTSELRFLRPETQIAIKRYTISIRDVYISIAGSIGITGMIPPELEGANLTENAAKLVLRTGEMDARFLMHFLGSETAQKEIRSQTVKNAQPKLALARIASLKIPIPTIEEQREIAAVLDALGHKQNLTTRKHAALTALFRTLLHQLMTAQIRTDKLELNEVNL